MVDFKGGYYGEVFQDFGRVNQMDPMDPTILMCI